MNPVPGTEGYEHHFEHFVRASHALKFDEINREFLDFLPPPPARVLDLGAGVGQNAAALCRRGYSVVAVEPLEVFLASAQSTYQNLDIDWRQGGLPQLECLAPEPCDFDFVLIDGVWHHLKPQEREQTLKRLAKWLRSGGMIALSLRNGPAGVGTHVFPTSSDELVRQSSGCGFRCLRRLEELPSKMPHKPQVRWSKVVLQKQ